MVTKSLHYTVTINPFSQEIRLIKNAPLRMCSSQQGKYCYATCERTAKVCNVLETFKP